MQRSWLLAAGEFATIKRIDRQQPRAMFEQMRIACARKRSSEKLDNRSRAKHHVPGLLEAFGSDKAAKLRAIRAEAVYPLYHAKGQ